MEEDERTPAIKAGVRFHRKDLKGSRATHKIPIKIRWISGSKLVVRVGLTYWGWNKMVEFRRWHFQMCFIEWKLLYFDSNFTKCYFQSPVVNKLSLDQVMACCCWTGDKPLSQLMMAQLTDKYRHVLPLMRNHYEYTWTSHIMIKS